MGSEMISALPFGSDSGESAIETEVKLKMLLARHRSVSHDKGGVFFAGAKGSFWNLRRFGDA